MAHGVGKPLVGQASVVEGLRAYHRWGHGQSRIFGARFLENLKALVDHLQLVRVRLGHLVDRVGGFMHSLGDKTVTKLRFRGLRFFTIQDHLVLARGGVGQFFFDQLLLFF